MESTNLFDTNPLFIVLVVLLVITALDFARSFCGTTRIEYRYVPRSFIDEQDDPIPLKDLVGDMFDRQAPWKASFNIYEKPKIINVGGRDLVVPMN